MNQVDQVFVDDFLTKMREMGYAVVAFSPEELEGADPDKVSDRLIELGWDVIWNLK